jgi:hypothetical protein
MTTITRLGLKRDGLNITEIFKDYHKETQNHITVKDYQKIVAAVHRKAYDKMCERDYAIQLSNVIGSFELTCYLPEKKEHRAVDRLLSKVYGKTIYNNNAHTDGKRFRIKHWVNKMIFATNDIFHFKMCRNFNRELATKLKSKQIPLWT